ncbi:hypothetical protein L227DRAFT_44241 [Lentinus tigrinus ALCF2SS1-6]|uniref:Uncharacterized protein n=1 Tax=Lentinus tigrinus ALCF2SS1-6 TaxID=1328759 RepID=A0A5C2SKE9_9APHY|nr:hypothetical protein L227DRAFT_44241 [Lentinus tigrinus ALCF2SS1-6]
MTDTRPWSIWLRTLRSVRAQNQLRTNSPWICSPRRPASIHPSRSSISVTPLSACDSELVCIGLRDLGPAIFDCCAIFVRRDNGHLLRVVLCYVLRVLLLFIVLLPPETGTQRTKTKRMVWYLCEESESKKIACTQQRRRCQQSDEGTCVTRGPGECNRTIRTSPLHQTTDHG